MKEETYTDIKNRLYPALTDEEGTSLLSDPGDVTLMLALCKLIYELADLRKIARKLNLKADLTKGAFDYQLLVGDYNFIGEDGKQTDVPEANQVPAHELSIQSLENLIEKRIEFNEARGDELTVRAMHMFKFAVCNNYRAFINNFDAADDALELVYAITALVPESRSNSPSRISVVFRGSVTLNDWLHNFQFIPVELSIRLSDESKKMAWLVEGATFKTIQINPKLAKKLLENVDGKPPPKIFVHYGFLNYLFADQRRNGMTKYKAIVANLILLLDHPKFASRELTVTGHSLGGALSSLLSFLLACDSSIWDARVRRSTGASCRYITCISFAAPHVGDAGFQRACHVIQDDKRLKHLRITNDRDFVPVGLPLVAPTFRQTGLQMHLRPKAWWGLAKTQWPKAGGEIGKIEWKGKANIRPPETKGSGRKAVLGLIFTTVPFLYWAVPCLAFRGISSLLPLAWSTRLLQSTWFQCLDTTSFLVISGWQIIILFARRPWEVVQAEEITHSLAEYYKNLDMEKLNSKQIFEKEEKRIEKEEERKKPQ